MWRVDSSQVMAEVLDGEAVIIDLVSGRYHAASGVAATVWSGLTVGHSFDKIMVDVRRAHTGVPDDAEFAVRRFIDEVVACGLAAPFNEVTSTSDNRVPIASEPTPWGAPVLESYDDLADLLLLDPVHDVTEAGWPHAAPPQ